MSDDADIDALMSSVLGKDGSPAAFPERPARPAPARIAATPRLRIVPDEPGASVGGLVSKLFGDPPTAATAASRVARQGIAGLSGELAAVLAKNTPPAPPKIIDPRSIPVRFSNLKHIARSALHYWDAVQLDREDTMAMRLGRGAHAMVLGMPVILWTGKTRNGKEWERFKAEHADKEILNRSEWARAEGIANAIRKHRLAAPLLFDGTVLEEIIEWEFLGRKCTSRPDSRRLDGRIVTDLKTTRNADPAWFKRDAMLRAYDAQLSFYDLASAYKTGRDADELYATAVESKRPYACTVLRLTDEARERGRKLCRLWFEQLLNCEAANHWPAYVDHIVDLDVLADDGELQLTIDGETYDFDAEAAP